MSTTIESQKEESMTAAGSTRHILSLPVHQWLESAQQSHGIPHHDYSQYHAYCTRRLSRLRHAKEVRKDLVHSSAYVSGSSGGGGGGSGGGKQTRRHAYVPRDIIPALPTTTSEGADDEDEDIPAAATTSTTAATITPKELHENILWVLLVGAERAWAHAGELRARYSDGNNSNKTSDAFASLLSSSSKAKRSPGQLRHHSLRRLKRAQQLAHQLEQVALQFSQQQQPQPDNHDDDDEDDHLPVVVVDPRTVQECQAYASWMRANWALETADWKTACEEYRSAITMCRKLSQLAADEAVVADENGVDDEEAQGTNIAESLELRDLFTTRADNMLPLLKYCQYEWREANGGSLPESWQDFEATLTTTTKKDLGGGSTVTFREQEIPIENKNLRVLLLKAEGLLQQQQQESTGTNNTATNTTTTMDQDGKFATLLSTFDDAMSLVTQELKSYEGAKAGPAVNAKRRELELLSGYIQYEKLVATCRRLEALLPTLTEDAEIVHVYDALLQNARAILSLPSSSGKKDTAQQQGEGGEDEDDEFWLQANANVLRIRAFRCYYMAKLYANGQQYGQAKALLKQAKLLSTRALEEIAACDEDMEHGREYMTSLQQLQDYDLLAMTCRVQAQAFLSSQQGASRSFYHGNKEGSGTSGTSRSLLVRLSDFDPGQPSSSARQLADVPPDVLPLPCKPVFYDVVWNYHASQFPDLEPLLEARKRKTTTTTTTRASSSSGGGGLLGWFRGGASEK